MNKQLLVYGPTSEPELFHCTEAIKKRLHLVNVLDLTGKPSSNAWNELIQDISTYCGIDAPNIAAIHTDTLHESLDIAKDFDLIVSYGNRSETGAELYEIHRLLPTHHSARFQIGFQGQRDGFFLPVDQSVEPAYGGILDLAQSGTKKKRYNCLEIKEVDWEDVRKRTSTVNVDYVTKLTEQFNLKCHEALFQELYGSEYDALKPEYRIGYRLGKYQDVFEAYNRQLDRVDVAISLNLRELGCLGYSRELLDAYNAVLPYLQSGVILYHPDHAPMRVPTGLQWRMDLYDSGPSVALDWTLEKIVELGEMVKALPGDTIVTAVDYVY